jgi:hypothetical protein
MGQLFMWLNVKNSLTGFFGLIFPVLIFSTLMVSALMVSMRSHAQQMLLLSDERGVVVNAVQDQQIGLHFFRHVPELEWTTFYPLTEVIAIEEDANILLDNKGVVHLFKDLNNQQHVYFPTTTDSGTLLSKTQPEWQQGWIEVYQQQFAVGLSSRVQHTGQQPFASQIALWDMTTEQPIWQKSYPENLMSLKRGRIKHTDVLLLAAQSPQQKQVVIQMYAWATGELMREWFLATTSIHEIYLLDLLQTGQSDIALLKTDDAWQILDLTKGQFHKVVGLPSAAEHISLVPASGDGHTFFLYTIIKGSVLQQYQLNVNKAICHFTQTNITDIQPSACKSFGMNSSNINRSNMNPLNMNISKKQQSELIHYWVRADQLLWATESSLHVLQGHNFAMNKLMTKTICQSFSLQEQKKNLNGCLGLCQNKNIIARKLFWCQQLQQYKLFSLLSEGTLMQNVISDCYSLSYKRRYQRSVNS